APNTTITWSPVYGSDFVNENTTFTLSASDNLGGSGIDYIEYQYTGSGGWLLYIGPFNLSNASNGTIAINYRAVDHAGEIEAFGTLYVRLDSLSPVTQLDFTPTNGPSFVNDTTSFTFSIFEGAGESGIFYTEYRVNGGSWINYTGAPFNLSSFPEGATLIEYRSIDNAGNVEPVNSIIVYLGFSDPITTSIDFTPVIGPNRVNGATLFSFTVSTLFNQTVNRTSYRLNNGSWQQYLGPFNLSSLNIEGSVTIEYYSVDDLGNIESIRNITVILDAICPLISSIFISLENVYVGDVVEISINCDSPNYSAWIVISFLSSGPRIPLASSGVPVNSSMTSLGNGTYKYTWDTSGLAPGMYNISIFVEDDVGNLVIASETVDVQLKEEKLLPVESWVIIIVLLVVVGAVVVVGVSYSKKRVTKAKKEKTKVLAEKKKGKPAPTYTSPDKKGPPPSSAGLDFALSEDTSRSQEVGFSLPEQEPEPPSPEQEPDILKKSQDSNVRLLDVMIETRLMNIFEDSTEKVVPKSEILKILEKSGYYKTEIESVMKKLVKERKIEYVRKGKRGYKLVRPSTMESENED
ncbi:MAG: OmpL47-type beta-barrel domain-containing protein, partial [Promethearchaeota archaeon]